MPQSVTLEIINCMQCPYHDVLRTPGADYAMDYVCKRSVLLESEHGFREIVGYVEWPSQEPQDHAIPDWCPLAVPESLHKRVRRSTE